MTFHLVFYGTEPYTEKCVTGHAYGKTAEEVKTSMLFWAFSMRLTNIGISSMYNTRENYEAVYGPQPADFVFAEDLLA